MRMTCFLCLIFALPVSADAPPVVVAQSPPVIVQKPPTVYVVRQMPAKIVRTTVTYTTVEPGQTVYLVATPKRGLFQRLNDAKVALLGCGN